MKKKYCLFGIHGVHNYGCEAMIRAIAGIIHEKEPDSIVEYMSYSYAADANRLRDCSSVIVKPLTVHARSKNPKQIMARAVKFIRKKTKICRAEDRLPFDTKWLKECDGLIIIGGDVFDLLPGQTTGYNNERIWASKVVKEYNGRVYPWGISIGSNISTNNDAQEAIINYFRYDVNRAAIRDEYSNNYLVSKGIDNTCVYADPAFMIRTTQIDKRESEYLGINLSPLANRYIDQTKPEKEWIDIWGDFIEKAMKKLNCSKVMLIPHVCISKDLSDDDYSYLSKVLLNLQDRGIIAEIAPNKIGFIKIKEYICKCKVLISARMHCSINSITCGVPTVFLSYSSKSVGMSKYVYGTTKYAINIKEIQIESIVDHQLEDISDNLENMRKYLQQRNRELYDEAREAYNYLLSNN